ncbi:NAD-glutamate dehydrogenase, partial [Alishewanella sp. SMS9]|nr:NAD-glutamate dehydrogenase [Alishewanella sp. SMS9]
MTKLDSLPSVLLQNVSKLIKQKVKEQVTLVEKFALTLYGNMSNEDLVGRNDSDLYGAALSLWQTLNQHADAAARIRVFNPELARHGWESKHTIVELVVQDMPFLVDSVRMALTRHGITAHLLLHNPLQTKREKDGTITDFSKLGRLTDPTTQQTVFHIEIDRMTDASAIDALKAELLSVMEDVSLAVQDWQPAKQKLEAVIAALPKHAGKASKEDIAETTAFLN